MNNEPMFVACAVEKLQNFLLSTNTAVLLASSALDIFAPDQLS